MLGQGIFFIDREIDDMAANPTQETTAMNKVLACQVYYLKNNAENALRLSTSNYIASKVKPVELTAAWHFSASRSPA